MSDLDYFVIMNVILTELTKKSSEKILTLESHIHSNTMSSCHLSKKSILTLKSDEEKEN